MKKYLNGEELRNINVEVDKPLLGGLELDLITSLVKESKVSAAFSFGTGGSISASPIVHNNIIYFGANDHNYYCLDLDGKELWRFDAGAQVSRASKIYKNRIYFGSINGNFYALNLNGKLVWKFQAKDSIAYEPIITENMIIFGSKDRNLYCLDLNGKLLWKFKTNGAITDSGIIHNNMIFFGSWDKNFYALKSMSGKLVWKFRTTGIAATMPSIHNNVLYFGSFDKNLYTVSPKHGSLIWKFAAADKVRAIKSTASGIYFGCRDGCLYCLDFNGALKWKFKTKAQIPVLNVPVIHSGIIYIGSTDSCFYAVDEKTGKEIWKYKAGGPITTTAAIIENKIIFGSYDCNLYCLDLQGIASLLRKVTRDVSATIKPETQNLVWKFQTSLSFPSPLKVETLYPSKTAEIVWTPLETKEKEKYATGEGARDYGLNISKYGSLDAGYVSKKKKGYVG